MTDEEKLKVLSLQTNETKVSTTEKYTLYQLDIPYITKAARVDSRPIQLAVPLEAALPCPLVFIVHYPMDVTGGTAQEYLRRGWAVSSVIDFKEEYGSILTEDNLVFNSAALWTLRNRPEIDKNRICITGGSAGGYTTLMLTGLHLGLCCSVAHSPVTNVHYTFNWFFPRAYELNLASRKLLNAEQTAEAKRLYYSDDQEEKYLGMSMTKFPMLSNIAVLFCKNNENFPDRTDMNRYAALSPIGLAEDYTSPFAITHFTSDGFVPVDQVSKRYTYENNGESLPADFAIRLPKEPKHRVDCSLEELLPAELVKEHFSKAPEGVVVDMKFDPATPFNLNIYDEGPVQSYSSHRLICATGGVRDMDYFVYYIGKGAAETAWLNADKLSLLLDRYLGKSIQLPARAGVDASVYGSPEVYRAEVAQELTQYAEAHGRDAVLSLSCKLNAEQQAALQEIFALPKN